MTKLPGFMFYPGDWMKDPAVRSVSLEARGLWTDMLCLMFESDRRGFLQHATGKPISQEQLSRMVGCSPDLASRLLQELEDSGVFSRTEHGLIYSRRMVRDEHIRQARSECGKKGGNPLLKQNSTKPPTEGKAKLKQNAEYENESENESSSSLKSSSKKPTLQEIQTYCVELKLNQHDAEWVFDKWQGSGWKNNGRAIADWKATIRSWQKISIFPSQRQNGNHKQNGKPSRDPAKSNNDMACICCKKSFVEAALGGYQRPCKCDPMSWCEDHMRCRVCCGCTADIPPTGVTKGEAKSSESTRERGIRPV